MGESDEKIVSPFGFAALIAGCAETANVGDLSAKYRSASTSTLWFEQATTSSPLELAVIEAELGARGQTVSGSRYLGNRTAAAYGQRLYSRMGETAPAGGGKDCADFSGAAEAQRYFLANGEPTRDPHNFDGDGDGIACEWGKTISRISKGHAYKPVATAWTTRYRPSASSYCHVGPRGGRYTITASGRKNYGGC